jgi:hypothetical protein
MTILKCAIRGCNAPAANEVEFTRHGQRIVWHRCERHTPQPGLISSISLTSVTAIRPIETRRVGA